MDKENTIDNSICPKCGKADFYYMDDIKFCNICGEYIELKKDSSRSIKINKVYDDKIHMGTVKLNKSDLNKIKLNNDDFVVDKDNLEKNIMLNYKLDTKEESFDILDMEGLWTYIEDEDGLSELLEDKSLYEKNFKEEYPGLITIKKNTDK